MEQFLLCLPVFVSATYDCIMYAGLESTSKR